MTNTYWYLATVYRKHAGGLDAAAAYAARVAATFVDAGVSVFSPVTHSHSISLHTATLSWDPRWLNLQVPFMRAANGLIVVEMDHWMLSEGIRYEIEWFRKARRPIVHVTPMDPVGDFRKIVPA